MSPFVKTPKQELNNLVSEGKIGSFNCIGNLFDLTANFGHFFFASKHRKTFNFIQWDQEV
jgi:hypothetical protein